MLPVLVLSIRPTAHIAQVLAGLLAEELRKQYIVASIWLRELAFSTPLMAPNCC